jgi:hypothetical protein
LGVAGRLEYMDGHERLPQDDEGNEAVRQVVKFVALRDMAGNPTALAAKLLQELPGQMLDWFGMLSKTCSWFSRFYSSLHAQSGTSNGIAAHD